MARLPPDPFGRVPAAPAGAGVPGRQPLRLATQAGRVAALAALAEALVAGKPPPDPQEAAVLAGDVLAFLESSGRQPLEAFLGIAAPPRSRTTARALYRRLRAQSREP